jgi:hypothetical protein
MNLLKKTVLVSAASLMVTSAFALTATESQVLTQKILASKVVDMPLVAAKLVVSADKADRIEVAKAAAVAVAKSRPTSLSMVVGAILRKAPEATEAVVAACLEVAPQMARTVVAAATFATEGQDAVILATADRLVPAQQAEVRGEVTLAKSRRAMKTSTTAKRTINISKEDVNEGIQTTPVLPPTLPPGAPPTPPPTAVLATKPAPSPQRTITAFVVQPDGTESTYTTVSPTPP